MKGLPRQEGLPRLSTAICIQILLVDLTRVGPRIKFVRRSRGASGVSFEGFEGSRRVRIL